MTPGPSLTIPVDDVRLMEGAALFLTALVYPQHPERFARLCDAFGAFVARAIHHHAGADALSSDLSALMKRVKAQQMNNQLNRAHRAVMDRLLTRDHILGGVLRPWNIPIAGVAKSLKLVTSRATTREVSRRRRDPADVQRDRIWATSKRLNSETAGPMPQGFAGRLGPEPIPANETVVTEDIDASLNAVVIQAAKQVGTSPRNYRRDYLNPARPVLHMAQALFQLISEVKHHEDREEDSAALIRHFSPRRLVMQPQWVRKAIADANHTREFWAVNQQAWPGLQAIDPEQFIRLVPDPPDC